MQIGLFLTNQQPLGTDQVRALDEQLELVRTARDAGWDAVFAGQHYLSESLTHIQPLPYLARLSSEAGDMRIGLGILLLALQNPLDVAENFASLDVVTGGRLTLGVGLGYRDVEYDAFAIGRTGRVARFEANLDIVLRLWAGEEVDADLPWCRLSSARLNLLPVQQPRPPLWMAANSDGAVRRAARLADAWMVNPHATVSTIRRQVDLYRETRSEAGTGAGAGLPVMREIFCGKDRATAVERAAPYLAEKYRTYARWGQDKVMPGDESFDIAYEELAQQRFIVGSPEDCLEALLPWRDEVGADALIFRTHWAGMPLDSARDSVNLLAQEVVPVLKGHAG
ncbi:LLM class flavin-dependent oxidoreductase [Knoellia sp. Soil729]|uniref:LLM class flavin-dependent oxidoreductase n=1 Tax=Knoellia sp. Soil729 TaxID=1736394 RepID=UPI0006FF0531|nr:LLM class flavin-dependent oxidoreductase [Knoellia sp. Soil729]KRE40779.1 luciferase [Knoellia sp. Soil729]